jgi:toxin ParE1/3/4
VASYKLRPRARADLEEIWDYSSTTWSIERAGSHISSIRDVIDKLAANPLSGQSAEHIAAGYRKQVCGSHVVFYVARTGFIDVVRILHGRTDLPARLGEE